MPHITIFCSCHPEDKEYWEQLRKQLWWLRNYPEVSVWQEDMIGPGQERENEINRQLSGAEIILLFISSDFMESQQHYHVEMEHAVERHDRGDARVIPILLHSTSGWEEAPFGKLQPLPKNREFITDQLNPNTHRVYREIADEIRKVVKGMREEAQAQFASSNITAILPLPTGSLDTESAIPAELTTLSELAMSTELTTPTELAVPTELTTLSELAVPDVGDHASPVQPVLTSHPTTRSSSPLRTIPLAGSQLFIQPLQPAQPSTSLTGCVWRNKILLGIIAAIFIFVSVFASIYRMTQKTAILPPVFPSPVFNNAIETTTIPNVGMIEFGLTKGDIPFSQDASANEQCIYQQNQKITGAYITVVAVTTLSTTTEDSVDSKASAESGNEELQGICLRQIAYNEQPASSTNGKKLRVIIANIGTKADKVIKTTVPRVVEDIKQLATSDPTLIGVVGLPFSSSVLSAMPELEKAGIPVVSPAAASDLLSDNNHVWNYFFRILPDTQVEADDDVQFIIDHNRHQASSITSAVVFKDHKDPYSESLGTDFLKSFNNQQGQGWHATLQEYTVDDGASIDKAVMGAQSVAPQMIFCACYANDFDRFFSTMSHYNAFDHVLKMGGAALYELGGYTNPANYKDTYYSALAYPDTTNIMCNQAFDPQLAQNCLPDTYCGYVHCASSQSLEPANFNDFYCKKFNPKYTVQHPCENGSGYGQSRPGQHTLLAFDATSALLNAYNQAAQPKMHKDVRDALATLQSFQGLSGQIIFSPNVRSDPVNKAVLLLYVDICGKTHLAAVYGQFLPGGFAKNGSFSPQQFAIDLSQCQLNN